jgi:hypothetical protein
MKKHAWLLCYLPDEWLTGTNALDRCVDATDGRRLKRADPIELLDLEERFISGLSSGKVATL